MDVNIDNLLKLQNDSRYYLSDNGEIKKAGLLTRIKCFFNIGHSRERVTNLVNAIKNTLVNSAGGNGEQKLHEDIDNIDFSRGIEGSEIKEFTQNFRVKNKKYIIQYQANRTAEELVNNAINDLAVNSSSKVKNSDNLRKLLLKGVEKDLKNPPMRQNNGQEEVDLVKLKIAVNSKLNILSRSLVNITRSDTLGKPDITNDYVVYLEDILLNEDGPVDDIDINNLKNPDESFSERIIEDLCKDKPERVDSCKQLVDIILRECKDDPDLRDILLDNTSNLIMRGDSVRSPESLQERLDAIKDNLNDFRTLSLSNPHMLDFGKMTLNQAAGKPLFSGVVNRIFESISSANISDIVKINSKSNSSEIHKAVLQLVSVISDALDEKGLSKLIEQDEKTLYRELACGMLALRLTPEQRQSLSQVLGGLEYSKLNTLYEKLADDFKASKDFTKEVAKLHSQIAFDISVNVGDMYNSLRLLTGKDNSIEFKKYVGQIDSKLEQTVKKDLLNLAKNESDLRIERFFNLHFHGEKTGNIKSYLKDSFLNKPIRNTYTTTIFNPEEMFSNLIKQDVSNFVNLHFLRSMKKLTGDNPIEAAFFRDIGRLEVKLSDGRMLNKDDPQTALNELASFVIGRDNVNFSELNETEKNKVRVVMSLLTLDTGKAISKGVPQALGKDNANGFDFVVNQENFTFTLEKKTFNLDKKVISTEFVLNCTYKSSPNTFVTDQGESGLNPGSSVEGNMRIVLNNKELERVAGLDYKGLDFTETDLILNEDGPANHGENVNNKLQKSMDTLPEDYCLKIDPRTGYSMDLK